MSAPRVLVVGSVLAQPMGGVRRHSQELLPRAAKLLRENGGSLAVLAGRDGLALELGDEIERIDSSVPSSPALSRVVAESRALSRVLAQARERGRPFDLVHTAHMPTPRGLDAPLTFTLHDLKSVFSAAEPRVRRWVGRCVVNDALKRSKRVLVVSQTLRDELLEHFDARPEQIVVAPNGADHLPLAPRAPAHDSPLLFVGHVEPRKNLALLLQALALDPQLPDLAIAGAEKSGQRAELEQLAARLGVAGRLRWLGLQSDEQLARLYASCACVALPSRREGFDIPLVEALRAGAPVACSDLPVHRELAGPAACYFVPDDAQAAADALRSAMDLPAAAGVSVPTWDACARAYVRAWS